MTGPASRPFAVYPALALGLVSFSSSAILVRFAADAPGMAIAVWRTTFAAVLLAPVALPRVMQEMRSLAPRDRRLILGAGLLLGLHFITWIESLYLTSVASASVLVTTSPIFLAVLGFVLLRERLAWPVVLGIVAAVAGAVLIALGDAVGAGAEQRADSWLGNGLALFASVLVSFYLLIGRVVRQKTSWLAYVFPLYTVVAVTTWIAALVLGTPLFGYDARFYVLCLVMAFGPQIVGHGSFNYAIRYFPAALLGLLSLAEPVGASIAAYFLFDEVPGGLALAGMVVVIVAVGSSILYRPRRTRSGDITERGGTAPVEGR